MREERDSTSVAQHPIHTYRAAHVEAGTSIYHLFPFIFFLSFATPLSRLLLIYLSFYSIAAIFTFVIKI